MCQINYTAKSHKTSIFQLCELDKPSVDSPAHDYIEKLDTKTFDQYAGYASHSCSSSETVLHSVHKEVCQIKVYCW